MVVEALIGGRLYLQLLECESWVLQPASHRSQRVRSNEFEVAGSRNLVVLASRICSCVRRSLFVCASQTARACIAAWFISCRFFPCTQPKVPSIPCTLSLPPMHAVSHFNARSQRQHLRIQIAPWGQGRAPPPPPCVTRRPMDEPLPIMVVGQAPPRGAGRTSPCPLYSSPHGLGRA